MEAKRPRGVLIDKLADSYFSGLRQRAETDTESARKLIKYVKESLISRTALTPQELIDNGVMLLDLEIAEFLFDVFERIEDGQSADHAFGLKQRGRKRPLKPQSEQLKDIILAKHVAKHIAAGKTQNEAVGDTEDELENTPWSASESRIKRAYREYRKYLPKK